jgi:hypothetical protein
VKLVGAWLLGTFIWIDIVTAYYWVSWHCGWGVEIWCPATVGGDYGLDGEALVEHVADWGISVPLIVALALVGGVLVRQWAGKQV